MINSKTKTISILLMLLLAFVGCAQPDMQEDLKSLQPEEKGEPVVAVINLPGSGAQTRTILPGELDLAHHYTITLTNDTLEKPIVKENITASDNQLKLVNVPVGKYNVHIDGHNEAGQIMLKGDGDKILDITLDSVAEVTVELFPQYGPELKGAIEVTFDWTALVKNEDTAPSDSQTVETIGPLKQAITDGYLEFELYTGKIGQELKKTGETVIWNTPDTTTVTCLFKNVPTGKNIYVALTVKDQYNNVIVDKQYGITAQVFADQTSYYNGDPNYRIHLGANQDKWYSNISNVSVTYPRENADSTFIVNWDDIRRGNDSIFSEIRFSYGKYNVPEAQNEEKLIKTFIPTQSAEDNHFEITGLSPNTQYYIKSQAISKSGKLSDTKIWTRTPEKGFMTKVNLGGIIFDADLPLPSSMTIGERFDIKANIKNEFATYPDLEYKVVDLATSPEFVESHDMIFFIDNPENNNLPAKVTANRPGVAKIEATNNDSNDPDYSKQTDTFVKVTLGKPMNVAAEIVQDAETTQRGIRISWNPVAEAEEYVIYRSDDKAKNPSEFIAIGEPSKTTSFTDVSLVTGHTYQYKVVATAPTIDAAYDNELYKFSATGADSDVTAPVLIPVPSIKIVPTVIEENKFELMEVQENGDRNYTYSDIDGETGNIDLFISLKANESRTIGLENPIEGFDVYTWLADNNVIISGTFEEASTIVLSDKLEQIDPGNLGSHTITFVASTSADPDNGPAFSANIGLTLVKYPVESVEASIMYKDTPTNNLRYSSNDAEGVLRLSGKAFAAGGVTPTVQVVQYRIAEGEDTDVATIDQYNGIITIKKYGTVKFEVYSVEDNTIVQPVTLTFYTPSVTSSELLVKEVNEQLSFILGEGDKGINSDWWGGATKSYKTSTMQAWRNVSSWTTQYCSGGIHLLNYPVTLSTIGNTELISNKLGVWAFGGTLGYDGNNGLHFIGYTGDKDNIHSNTIEMELPYNQGKAYIKYSNVNVSSETSNLGSYSVWYEHEILVAPDTILKYTKSNPDPVTATVTNRPTVKYR